VAPTELEVVRSMAYCLRELGAEWTRHDHVDDGVGDDRQRHRRTKNDDRHLVYSPVGRLAPSCASVGGTLLGDVVIG